MSERTIETMIAKVRDGALAQKRKRQSELETRRNEVLRRIGQAVVDHGLPIAQSPDVDRMLAARLQEAQVVRISEAEAMADLAEFDGDLSAGLYWWEIKTNEGTIIWKGYTLRSRDARVRFSVTRDGRRMVYTSNLDFGDSIHMDINVRRACYGALVASLYVEGGVEAVGISEGPGASVADAVTNAYLAYFEGKVGIELAREDVPGDVVDNLIDRMDDGAVESANSSSVTDSTISLREQEE